MAFERAAQIKDFETWVEAGPTVVALGFELAAHMPASRKTPEQQEAFVANGLATLDIEHKWNHTRKTQEEELVTYDQIACLVALWLSRAKPSEG